MAEGFPRNNRRDWRTRGRAKMVVSRMTIQNGTRTAFSIWILVRKVGVTFRIHILVAGHPPSW